jgi:hypothetical protein
MADYYSLLARAVAALPQAAPEARQAVYERARKALFNQLRSVQPPVAEADIEAEGRALDEAIARLELETVREEAAAAVAAAVAPEPPPAPSPAPRAAPSPAPERPPAAAPASFAETEDRVAEEARAPEPDRPVDESPAPPQRPAAPLPPLPTPQNNSRRMLVIAGVLAAVVALVALLALQFRERPEDLARLKPEPPTGEIETEDGGKLADRVGGQSEQTAESGGRTAPDAGANKKPPVPVAQKAELWVAAPEEANKVKTYPGTVIWRLESLAAGAGEPVTPAIRGDIDIPGEKLKASIVIQKNLDPTFSASHTINVSFSLAPGSQLKGVKAIGPLQMRRPEAQAGEQVAGVPVPITENNFLIGLLRGAREARNVTLLRSPMVVDLPMQLEDGRAATISMEKGPSGDRVFIDALDAWAQR